MQNNFELNDQDMERVSQTAKSILGPKASDEIEKLFGNKEKMNMILSQLSDKDMQNVKEILSNPQLLKKILSSPKAAEGLRKLTGD